MNNLTNKSDDELRELLQVTRQMLTFVVDTLAKYPDMQNAITRLMKNQDDILETFNELAGKNRA